MKILLTGGAGFIASHICDRLICEGHEVVVIDNLSTGRLELLNPRAYFYQLDLCDPAIALVFQIEKPELVIHHAAQVSVNNSWDNPVFDAVTNIIGSLNLFENCRQYKVKKIIYASSAAIYGEPLYLGIDEKHPVKPLSFYGLSKYLAEIYLKYYAGLFGLKFTILRYANVYGPRQRSDGEGGVVAIFLSSLLKGEAPVIFGQGEQSRDFIYVADIVEANIQALTRAENEVLNLGTGKELSINQLYASLKELLCSQLQPVYVPERPGDIMHSYFDQRKAAELLDWEPSYPLQEGLCKTIEYDRGARHLSC
ncbi:MAG: NAD-dependent epimerase/dehydratase family protein [Syntrophomonas sp.]|uniref:NAD-dependent epimerase/dehydratase family protein n=1 Tax=Syntrophomonas sp. TaxID=2053627 RepID=UPI002629690D|nr:NAD-dependent epimerase/dehydratase family protein [Syntrophomonas sp.]MDD2510137.1 NAD-dependent epimerase/dehydratase family protein [Syntrophomonas sp.]MDD3879563.1 NAD-dependent epimerase/dehydratase family protein [Syntrophomonas sp.]MDD4625968.1 NAD-dependent epimerase/dehydratase family protein [Syntrophomonas sp.]